VCVLASVYRSAGRVAKGVGGINRKTEGQQDEGHAGEKDWEAVRYAIERQGDRLTLGQRGTGTGMQRDRGRQ